MAEGDDHIHELCFVDDRYSLVIYDQFTLSIIDQKAHIDKSGESTTIAIGFDIGPSAFPFSG